MRTLVARCRLADLRVGISDVIRIRVAPAVEPYHTLCNLGRQLAAGCRVVPSSIDLVVRMTSGAAFMQARHADALY